METEPSPFDRRMVLHNQLLLLVTNVYFQPPPSVTMKYPCIVYSFDTDRKKYANNELYNRRKRYQVTHISRNPDDPVPDVLAKRQLCAFRRRFVTADLTHDVFDLFF